MRFTVQRQLGKRAWMPLDFAACTACLLAGGAGKEAGSGAALALLLTLVCTRQWKYFRGTVGCRMSAAAGSACVRRQPATSARCLPCCAWPSIFAAPALLPADA
eukprot:359876-Chlamydomonas_euryale.AAC.8